MPAEVVLGTPLADALNTAIPPKLVEVGLGTGGADDAALAELVVLMLVNGNGQQQIAEELARDLLGLAPDNPQALEFARWLFDHVDALTAQLGGGSSGNGGDKSMGDVAQEQSASGDMDTDMGAGDATELNAPTGPRSMRNGNQRGGRDKRMLGHMAKAMDRTAGPGLHRVRGQTGNERINTHARGPPTGPRGQGRFPRNNPRAANIEAGLNNMSQQWMMNGQGAPNNVELMAMMEQQNQMMLQLSQQLMVNGGGQNGHRHGRGGKSLFDRVHDPHNRQHNRRGGHHQNSQRTDGANGDGATAGGGDVDMGGNKQEAGNPEETLCRFNLSCTNPDCKYAHQSPAAPPGVTIDMSDVCSFGAACKNRKCVGRHPSPATRLAHQGEQDCKFFPNCQNPRCPFKHPTMPLCRNGAGCTTPNCKFTHVKTKCKFNPCLNRNCAFAHDEGQQGGFKDKVWTADGAGEHVSDRKFVDDQVEEEVVKAEENPVKAEEEMAQDTDVIG